MNIAQGGDGARGGRALSDRQSRAIWLAVKIGDDIRKNHPEIAEQYRSGLTASQMVAWHRFDRLYGVSRRTAIDAVGNAIRGHSCDWYEPYEGLVPDSSERECLALAHNRQAGKEQHRRKLGIHALTHEQKVESGRKGGLIRGPLSYQLGIGCHALPPEVLREHCRRIAPLGAKAGGVASVRAKGLVPYAPAEPGRISELEFAWRLSKDPRYLGPERVNYKSIAEKLGRFYRPGDARYTRTSLKIALQMRRRRTLADGHSPEDPELALAEALSLNPAYRLPARMKAVEIARKVNEEYHGGKRVRNAMGIRTAIRRYRASSARLAAG